jgi:hypothetical protein
MGPRTAHSWPRADGYPLCLEPGLAYAHVGTCRRAELAHAAQGFPTLGRQRGQRRASQQGQRDLRPARCKGHGRTENCLPASATVGQHQHPHPHARPASEAHSTRGHCRALGAHQGVRSSVPRDAALVDSRCRPPSSQLSNRLCLSAVDASRSLAYSLEARSSKLGARSSSLVTRDS